MKNTILKSLLAATTIIATAGYATAQDCNAHFSHTQRTDNPFTVYFEPVGESMVISYEWNFGDGSPISASESPVHTYAEDGSYTVCLNVYTATDSCTVCTDICVNGGSTTSVGDMGLKNSDTRIFPNPGSDYWNLEINLKSAQDLDIQVADVAGKIVYKNTLKGKSGKNVTAIANKNIAAGVYFFTISKGSTVITKKAVKL